MITGVHAIIFNQGADGVRAFFRDTLGFSSVDAGGGWLIFALPPAELGIHPTDEAGHHELYLMCDDIHKTVEELQAKGGGVSEADLRGRLRSDDVVHHPGRSRARALSAEASHGDSPAGLNELPTPAAQSALLGQLRAALEPVFLAENVSHAFVLQPGLRLRRAYGRCAWIEAGQPPVISVRCTADGDRTQWRHTGAIVGTLLHELAHVRYRSHGPRFWALHRRLVDRAVAAGVYDPTDRDANEHGRGDEKLAGSAARPIAMAARQARRERARANRAALQAWQVGAVARISTGRGVLAGAWVRVTGLGRTRLLVETADRRRYRVAPALLVPA